VLIPRHEVAFACRRKAGHSRAGHSSLRLRGCHCDYWGRTSLSVHLGHALGCRWCAAVAQATTSCTGVTKLIDFLDHIHRILLCRCRADSPADSLAMVLLTTNALQASTPAPLNAHAGPCCAPVVPPTMTPSTPLATCRSSSLSYARKSNLPLGRYLPAQRQQEQQWVRCMCMCMAQVYVFNHI
jgi:hypothetical protein